MNNENTPHEVIVTGIHLELTPSLKAYVKEKMERLFRHENHIVRLRVELECDRKHDVAHKFVARAILSCVARTSTARLSPRKCTNPSIC